MPTFGVPVQITTVPAAGLITHKSGSNVNILSANAYSIIKYSFIFQNEPVWVNCCNYWIQKQGLKAWLKRLRGRLFFQNNLLNLPSVRNFGSSVKSFFLFRTFSSRTKYIQSFPPHPLNKLLQYITVRWSCVLLPYTNKLSSTAQLIVFRKMCTLFLESHTES